MKDQGQAPHPLRDWEVSRAADFLPARESISLPVVAENSLKTRACISTPELFNITGTISSLMYFSHAR